jgi:hypothetical protein
MIEDGIRTGLENTCKDAINFCGSFTTKVSPEYLITVNISQAIGNTNYSPGEPFLIRPEEPTRRFADRCVESIKWNNIFETIIRTGRLNTTRKGYLDIAIYNAKTSNPLTAIEVKLVSPDYKRFHRDIIRLMELLHLHDEKHGLSKIKRAYFACIEIDCTVKFPSQVDEHLDIVWRKYTRWLTEVFDSDDKTDFEVNVVSIEASLLLTDQIKTDDEITNADLYSQARHCAGVIIVLKRKLKPLTANSDE